MECTVDDLFELRFYVSKPRMFAPFRHQWMTVHFDIYRDYHDVRGVFEVLRPAPDPDTGETCAGIALVIRHEDRAAVDRSMTALIKSNRMNEVPGPPGRDIVDHWERTFLYPIAEFGATRGVPAADHVSVYELRSWLTTDDGLAALTEQADQVLASLAQMHSTERLFVSHPETANMPDGVAALIRHPDLETAAAQDDQQVIAELNAAAGPDLAGTITGCRRLLLRSLPISPMG